VKPSSQVWNAVIIATRIIVATGQRDTMMGVVMGMMMIAIPAATGYRWGGLWDHV